MHRFDYKCLEKYLELKTFNGKDFLIAEFMLKKLDRKGP